MQPVDNIPQDTREFFNNDTLRAKVFLDKYALRDSNGNIVETLPTQMWDRVATAIASVEHTEANQHLYQDSFKWLLGDFKFIPGGRILFGAGNPRSVSLLNCYVNPVKEDNIESIFDWMKESAKTYAYGGGVGTDISILRPRGSRVNNASLTSVGATSFMELFSLTTGTIGQAGRRGALMITMGDSHPDIMEFVTIKRNMKNVRFANISVRISDKFMQAVEKDVEFTLHFKNNKVEVSKRIKARTLWKELIKGARDWAEPGVLFWDTIKGESTSEYGGMEVLSTNPCGEIPLEAYGDCCLGNLNLSKFVLEEFTGVSRIDWSGLEAATKLGVRFLDNILTYNMGKHALPEQSEASARGRRIGLGFTGLGDMLCQLQLKYGSTEALRQIDEIFSRVRDWAYRESIQLGIEKGVFPIFNSEKHLQSEYIKRLPVDIQEQIRRRGLRNVALLTVPPVGSGAALAGTTSGVEPIFDLSYTRRSESLSQEFFKVYHPLVERYMKAHNLTDDKKLPEFFITAHQIPAEHRVKTQATIQKYIDHAISSTVNLPREATEEDVERIYFEAWKQGCKGITVYREGSREGVLITNSEMQEKSRATATTATLESKHHSRPRPKVTTGRTERIETPRGPIYVTINQDEKGLCEIFVRSLDEEADVVGRLSSLLLRSGLDTRELLEQLWKVRSREVAFDRSVKGQSVKVTTVSQGIALALGRFLYGEKFNPNKQYPKADLLEVVTTVDPIPNPNQLTSSTNSDPLNVVGVQPLRVVDIQVFDGVCPDCGSRLVKENGCSTCRDCGFSKCG